MDVLAWMGALGGLGGMLGGVCGVLALVRQKEERERQQTEWARRDKEWEHWEKEREEAQYERERKASIAHLPPELRPILLDIVVPVETLTYGPQNQAWTAENIEPLRSRIDPLVTLVLDVGHEDGGTLNTIHRGLRTIHAYAETEHQSPGRVAHGVHVQMEEAKKVLECSKELLRKLGHPQN